MQMHPIIRRSWPGLVGLSFLLVGLWLASPDHEPPLQPIDALASPLPPLKERGVPAQIRAEIYPAVGASSRRPVVLVLGHSSTVCGTARDVYRPGPSGAHVVCRLGEGLEDEFGDDEAALLEAVAFLKKRYARYVEGRPAHLITDRVYSAVGWRMLLADPAVFAFASLPGLAPEELSQTSLYALHSKGARTLVVDMPDSDRLALLSQVASRGGLRILRVPSDSDGERDALVQLRLGDARMNQLAAKP